MTLDPQTLQTVLDAAPEGVVVCDAREKDWPAVYVNAAMHQLTGYLPSEILGRNLRFLHADDHQQQGLERIRAALSAGKPCQALLRNYRKDGTLFWNDMRLVPIRDANDTLTHFVSFHREGYSQPRVDTPQVEERDPLLSTQTMLAYVREDKLTGLLRRSYFEDVLKRDWGVAQRESKSLTLFVFDLDYFPQYREVFGRAGADQSFRRIARVVHGCFRRASDLCGRLEDEQVVALTGGMEDGGALAYAEAILARIRDLAIHHPRSTVSRYLTASAGVATTVPAHAASPESLLAAALDSLRLAMERGRNRAVVAQPDK
jgi:diguanylate cyclase (GGDEF)-like protein/PAS domain S-box-containing protein